MVTKYVIIGPARSGTTVTHLVLKGHPEVSAARDEIRANALFGDGIRAFTAGNSGPENPNASFQLLFDALALANSTPNTRAAGIKCAVSSVNDAKVFVDRVRASFPDLRLIFTIRDDLLAQYGSLQRARKTGKWHSWVADHTQVDGKLHLDKALYSRYFLRNRAIIDTLLSLRATHRCLELHYEMDILPGLGFAERLYAFLGLTPINPTWVKSQKVAPPPQEFIHDYDALKAVEAQVDATGKPLRYGPARRVLAAIRKRTGS